MRAPRRRSGALRRPRATDRIRFGAQPGLNMSIPVPQGAANGVGLVFLHEMEPRTDVYGGQRLDVFCAPRHQVATRSARRMAPGWA